jgi:hypothetical protein
MHNNGLQLQWPLHKLWQAEWEANEVVVAKRAVLRGRRVFPIWRSEPHVGGTTEQHSPNVQHAAGRSGGNRYVHNGNW